MELCKKKAIFSLEESDKLSRHGNLLKWLAGFQPKLLERNIKKYSR